MKQIISAKCIFDEHVEKDKNSNINIHTITKSSSQVLIQIVFFILDWAPTQFESKIKEGNID